MARIQFGTIIMTLFRALWTPLTYLLVILDLHLSIT